MYQWKHCIERGISISWDMLFLLGSKEKSQKLQEQNSGSAKHFVLCSISLHFTISRFEVLCASQRGESSDGIYLQQLYLWRFKHVKETLEPSQGLS